MRLAAAENAEQAKSNCILNKMWSVGGMSGQMSSKEREAIEKSCQGPWNYSEARKRWVNTQDILTSPNLGTPPGGKADREERLQIRDKCVNRYDIPKCLVERTCTPESLGIDVNAPGFAESDIANRAGCAEVCAQIERVGLLHPMGGVKANVFRQHVKDAYDKKCKKYRKEETYTKYVPYVLGALIVYLLFIKK